jgi:hypothetical protein
LSLREIRPFSLGSTVCWRGRRHSHGHIQAAMVILPIQSAREANPRFRSALAGLVYMCLQDADSWRA